MARLYQNFITKTHQKFIRKNIFNTMLILGNTVRMIGHRNNLPDEHCVRLWGKWWTIFILFTDLSGLSTVGRSGGRSKYYWDWGHKSSGLSGLHKPHGENGEWGREVHLNMSPVLHHMTHDISVNWTHDTTWTCHQCYTTWHITSALTEHMTPSEHVTSVTPHEHVTSQC